MKIQVLGTGCIKCNRLYAEVERAVAQAGVNAELQKVEKLDEIMSFGVPLTPALVINGKVKSAGNIPGVSQIVAWITDAAQEK